MTKICKLTFFVAFWVQKLEIFCKNLNKSIIRFQCLGLFDFQYFALIESIGNRAIYLSIDNPQPSFECYLDVTDKISVCTKYSP